MLVAHIPPSEEQSGTERDHHRDHHALHINRVAHDVGYSNADDPALAGTKDAYEVASGTSMSSPNVAGGYAALLEAICNENPSLSKVEAAELARNRTLSHAYVLPSAVDELEDGSYLYTPYSPRLQGAGLIEVGAAYNADIDITDPLCELGDDPDRAGVYTVSAELKNSSDEEKTFEVSAEVVTDGGTYFDFGSDDAPDYHFYNTMQSVLLEEGVDYTLDAPETITLAPGETKTVDVTITLTEEMKSGYLEGVPGYLLRQRRLHRRLCVLRDG